MGRLHSILGNNIRNARTKLQYSQIRLAELCGISPSFLGEIETGKKFPSPDNLEKIAHVLGLKPYQLFYEEEEWEVFDRYDKFTSLYRELREKLTTDLEETIRKYLTSG